MKKKLSLIAALCLLLIFKARGQIGIGSTTIENDLLLKIASSNKGFLIPNLNIPDLNISSPVTNPAVGLLAYNNATGKEGFNFWDGSKWNELVDTNNVYSVLGLSISYSTSNSSSVDVSTLSGAINYVENSLPGTIWTEVPGLSKDITITQANNSVVVITEGMVQANNSTVNAANTYTYAIGVFVDGTLAGVRNYSANYGRSNQYDFFSINTLFKNLSVGTHTIKTYVTMRVNNHSSATSWKFGGAASSSVNNDMSRINMFIKLTEKS
ncbi:hypothetical protein CHRY9390_00062 [Chryseobacterium aquaeductus]|uniref:Uncharacterized protein n=1 Tax=Chryseobacterium aquaeductus TaxID=2675056 RepID=A0A9N8QPF3_9FLAO|nr:hypothetical protein [Chryseobacterium aquaeductus]CAA7329426.1 hypothetical protein CHRY9390_00062 [Chryseobacterium potabilaquae]CAD7796809.1 hypothetical protein CHRY9390_00062 [Chryseobacterium aquaeductus]